MPSAAAAPPKDGARHDVQAQIPLPNSIKDMLGSNVREKRTLTNQQNSGSTVRVWTTTHIFASKIQNPLGTVDKRAKARSNSL